ncbi:MAG: glycosyltransferase [Firmicutes bacterium]|jgi:hypothetical protein|nr:glycosyltransferase [Bacillota bacterium]
MTPKIGLALIVRDEGHLLARCLESAKDSVDEIVVVDTGSRDQTLDVSRRYTSRVYSIPWESDFARARNYAIDHVSAEWVLVLDADETLEGDRTHLRETVAGAGAKEGFLLPLHNHTGHSPSDYSRSLVLRLFRNIPEHRYRGRVHEQLTVASPANLGVLATPVIRHDPETGSVRLKKRARNLALLRSALMEDQSNPFLHYYVGIEWLGLGKPGLALPHFELARRTLEPTHLTFRLPAVRYLVACLCALGRLEDAALVCLEETSTYPRYTDLIYDGGNVFEELKEYEVAIRWFSQAIASGTPGLGFFHTNGTESFLSHRHLGNCLLQLGRTAEAWSHFQMALRENPDDIPALSSLFLAGVQSSGLSQVFAEVKAAGYLRRPAQAETLAALFFEAGSAALACECLVEAGVRESDRTPTQEHLRARIRYWVYGGRIPTALVALDRARQCAPSRALDVSMRVDEIAGLSIGGRLREAKTKALGLWRDPGGRGPALALINLLSMTQGGRASVVVPRAHERTALQTTLSLVECCLRGLDGDRTEECRRLAASGLAYLQGFGPAGWRAAVRYFESKARSLKNLVSLRFGDSGRLAP